MRISRGYVRFRFRAQGFELKVFVWAIGMGKAFEIILPLLAGVRGT